MKYISLALELIANRRAYFRLVIAVSCVVVKDDGGSMRGYKG